MYIFVGFVSRHVISDKKKFEPMEVYPFVVGPLETNAYVLTQNGKAVVIDPGADDPFLCEFLEKHSLQVEQILLTHGHYDHIGGVKKLKKTTSAKLGIHALDHDMLLDPQKNLSLFFGQPLQLCPPDYPLEDEMEIPFSSTVIRVLFTPGHTPGSVCFLWNDWLFSGDTLFCESIGRTDFPGGSLETLLNSIQKKFFTLPDDIRVYPGHGPETTIGHERKHNPFLATT